MQTRVMHIVISVPRPSAWKRVSLHEFLVADRPDMSLRVHALMQNPNDFDQTANGNTVENDMHRLAYYRSRAARPCVALLVRSSKAISAFAGEERR